VYGRILSIDNAPTISAKALIHQDGRYLLQHRDNDPKIWHPDHWGLFGGELDDGETPKQGLVRELEEELDLRAQKPRYLFPWYPRPRATIHIFLVQLDIPISCLELREGVGMDLFSLKEMSGMKVTPEISENWSRIIAHCERS
jgi:8-oxo-dGTP diphosphatase